MMIRKNLPSNPDEKRSIIEHLKELRLLAIICAITIAIGASIAHVYHIKIISFILKPIGGQQLVFLSPLDPVIFILKIDFISGFLFAIPVINFCVLLYIKPAFKKVSSVIYFFYILSAILLVGGLCYGFFIILPTSLRFLFSVSVPGIRNTVAAQNYLSFFLGQLSAIVLIFQIPLFITAGSSLGLFSISFLSSQRRWVYLGVAILLPFFTPTTDFVSMSMVYLPAVAIFELSLIAGRIVEFAKRKKA